MRTPKLLAAALAVLMVGAPVRALADGIHPSNKVRIGDKTASNKTIEFDKGSSTANPKLRWNNASAKLQFSNDGTNYKDFGSGSGSGSGINLIQENNPDFEVFSGGIFSNWTVSGASITQATSGTNLLIGASSAVFNSSAASQTFTSDAITVTASTIALLGGSKGSASCWFKTTATDYKIQAWDGTSVLSERVIPALSAPQQIGISFTIPSSGTLALRIISQSDAADLAIDNCSLGSGQAFDISQAELYGTVKATGCSANFATGGSATYVDNVSALTGCSYAVTGKVTAPVISPFQMGARLQNAPPGKYVFIYTGSIRRGNSNTDTVGMRFSDGTNTSVEEGFMMDSVASTRGTPEFSGSITYSNPIADSTVRVQAKAATGATDVLWYGTTTEPGTIKVYRFPLDTQSVQRFETTAQSWSGEHGSDCYFDRTANTFANPNADSTCTFTERSNTNFGTVTSYLSGSDKLPGIVVTPSSNGKYRVCATVHTRSGSGAGVQIFERLTDGTNVLDIAMSAEPVADYVVEHNLCGHFTASSTAPATLRIESATDSVSSINEISGLTTPVAIPAITWTIEKINEQMPGPLFTGNLTSNYAGIMRMETAYFHGGTLTTDCTGTCTISNSSSSWLTSVINGGTGLYAMTVAASTFSALPVCFGSATNGNQVAFSFTPNSTTSITLQTGVRGAASYDVAAGITCIGPR